MESVTSSDELWCQWCVSFAREYICYTYLLAKSIEETGNWTSLLPSRLKDLKCYSLCLDHSYCHILETKKHLPDFLVTKIHVCCECCVETFHRGIQALESGRTQLEENVLRIKESFLQKRSACHTHSMTFCATAAMFLVLVMIWAYKILG